MKNNYRKPLIYATAVVIPQLIVFLIDNSQGLAFLVSIVALVAYEIYEETVNVKEALMFSISFIITGLMMSAAAKVLIYNNLCEISRSATSSEMSTVLSSQDACLSLLEIFVRNISVNPIRNWYFWIANIAVAITVLGIYRRYSEHQ